MTETQFSLFERQKFGHYSAYQRQKCVKEFW